MKIYIAGPMSGYPDNNYGAFLRKQQELEEAGWEVINPCEMDLEAGLRPDVEFTRKDYMRAARRDLKALKSVDAIYMMSGYENSPGANWEWAFAKEEGILIYYEIPLCGSDE